MEGKRAMKLYFYKGIYTTSNVLDDRFLIQLNGNTRVSVKLTES